MRRWKPTTERVSPESWALRVTFWQSLAAYRWALKQAKGARVVDVGCGVGYGTVELAREAHLVIGLDQDQEALTLAGQRYQANNLLWVQGVADSLPFRDASVDLICCFQVLEHLQQPERFLQEARRILAADGILLLTTPNRSAVFSGLNPHHVREYDPGSLQALLRGIFDSVTLFGVFPSERVAVYRAANRRAIERILRLDPLGLHRILPTRLRSELHTWGTFLLRRWLNRRLRQIVESIDEGDFVIRQGDLTQAIDLVAVIAKTGETKGV